MASSHRYALFGLLLACCVAIAPAADAPSSVDLLSVRINGHEQGDSYRILRLPDGSLAVTANDLQAWRINPPSSSLSVRGRAYYRLNDIPGAAYRIESSSQTLLLEVPAAAFGSTTLSSGQGTLSELTPASPGGFLNYDLLWQHDGTSSVGSGLFEAGIFNQYGAGVATTLWNNSRPERQWVRLDTTWTMDDPAEMRSLRLGDAINRSGSWGRSVRFGGIQWGTNFATRPDFIAFPRPALRGEAALPSTLDVFVNNIRQFHDEVPAGPFDIPTVPVVTGQGEMRMVVTDLLGRQQVVTSPYYVSSSLLRPGLHDYSVEAGSIREDYGLFSNHYGRTMLAATDRLGISDSFTRELHAELLRDQQTLGAGGVWLWPRLGTLNLAAAVSHGETGMGNLLQAGVDRQARDLSFGLQVAYAGRNFTQLGTQSASALRRRLSANMGTTLGHGSLGASWLLQDTWDGTATRFVSANYNAQLGTLGFLGLYAMYNYSGKPETTLGVTLSHSFDNHTSASADFNRAGNRQQSTLQLQRNLPLGNGFGYQLLAGQGEYDRYDASGIWRTDHGDLNAQLGSYSGNDYYRLGVSGGLAVLGGHLFSSRRIDESFAVVKVDDFAGVRVYRDNQEIGRTNSSGLILVTRLLPYQANAISVEQSDLPLETEVDKLHLRLTPALRSGIYVEVPIHRTHGATFRLVDEAGQPLPPGTALHLRGHNKTFPVGYEGRAYVNELDNHSDQVLAEWAEQSCVAELPAVQEGKAMPNLGTITCKDKVK